MEQTFHLDTPEIKANCIAFMVNLPTDGSLKATITKNDQGRSNAQNNLLWHWNGEVTQQTENKNPKKIHAITKRDVLLGLYLSWGGKHYAEGAITQEAMGRCQNTGKHDKADIQAFIADRMLRTNKLGVKKFTEYLNAYAQHWGESGVQLTTGDDLYYAAMGRAR